MDFLVNRALELGAEKARLIETSTVAIEEWVRWKCQYGCMMYGKSGHHPPGTPDAESTRRVFSEFSKAIMLTGPKPQAISGAALRLESEAYQRGYYKAFALVASSGATGAG